MSTIDNLKYAIKMKFGTAPNEPTDTQLKKILDEISIYPEYQRTVELWRSIVKKHIPSAGSHGYYGLDNSDLNQLYAQLINSIRR